MQEMIGRKRGTTTLGAGTIFEQSLVTIGV